VYDAINPPSGIHSRPFQPLTSDPAVIQRLGGAGRLFRVFFSSRAHFWGFVVKHRGERRFLNIYVDTHVDIYG